MKLQRAGHIVAASHQLVYLGISAAARTVVKYRDVSLVQNVGGVLCRGSGDKVPQKLNQFWISICIILT